MIVRRATREDYPKILEIEYSSFSTDFITEELLDESPETYVLEVDGEVVAYAVWYFNYDNISGNCYLYSLAVNKYSRRKGYSRLLLDKFISTENSIYSLHVSSDNQSAISLYESCGFKIVETVDNFYEDGRSALYMLKEHEDQDKPLLRETRHVRSPAG
jgi:ribosomal-protein-alanine N-acetyltransferase